MRTGPIEFAISLVLASTMAATGCSGSTNNTGSGGASAGSSGGAAAGSTGIAGSTGVAGSGGGTTGAAGTGGGSAATSIDGSKPLNTLTPAEITQLCDDTKTYFASSITKANSCRFFALNNAASTSAPSSAMLQSACTAMEASCNASATMGPGAATKCFPPPATCTATVAQHSACISDQTVLFNQAVATLPDCGTVRLADISTIFTVVESFYQAAGCMTLTNACPDLVFPIVN